MAVMSDNLEVTDRSFVFHDGARLGVGRTPGGGVLLRLTYGREELAVTMDGETAGRLAEWITLDGQQRTAGMILAECVERYGRNGRKIAGVILTEYGNLGECEAAKVVGLCRQTIATARETTILPVDAVDLVEQVRAWGLPRRKRKETAKKVKSLTTKPPPAVLIPGKPGKDTKKMECIKCGCTDEDCGQCVAAQGHPCHWVGPGKCSRCFCKCGEELITDREKDEHLCEECLRIRVNGLGKKRKKHDDDKQD